MEQFDLICLGCGPAGEKAATQASYFGHRVAIVERQPRPGGAMVNTGTLPSKVLRETALLCSAFRRRPLPGMDYTVDTKSSMTKFMARQHLAQMEEHDRIEASIDRHNIAVFRGFGRIVDPNTIEIESESGERTRISAKFILLATGSSPVQPDHVPFDHPRVVDADGVLELDHMPSSMIVVGGGVIGCEYACMFGEIGVKVTLVEPRPEILPFVDVECRDLLLKAMRQEDIDIRLGDAVNTVEPSDDGVKVQCADGDELAADVLLWAAGRSSNTQNLGLEAVGVEMGKRGLVLVNETYQTSVPSIYAAGDVIGFPALASTSMEQGRVAACHMFGINFKKKLAKTMPIGLYTIPAVSMVGLTESEAHEAGRSIVVGRAAYRNNARGRMLGDQQGLVKCVFDRETHALLGATIIGESATELIHLAQCVLIQGVGIEYFIDACFNYPSLSELYKYAAYDALQVIARDKGSGEADLVRAVA
ncbi:MAG: Si-specific NAD(P)(+) transhydrogenase [Planctomycetes bacterium]|nr:Si-specific NAD(P)(+) transhydrogenase [Planctomycetota bacterium]